MAPDVPGVSGLASPLTPGAPAEPGSFPSVLTSRTGPLCILGAKPLQGGWVPGPHPAQQPQGPQGALFGHRGALS